MPRSKGDTTNTPAPLAVQNLFDSLGLLTCATTRLSLWQDLVRFHEDPLHKYRKYMTLSQNREELKAEVHKFLRQHGQHYFSQQYLEPGVAVYKENSSTEEIFITYEPLFHALLYLCRRASQKKNQERNKQDWKQWEAVRSSLNSASGHDDLMPREPSVVDDEIYFPQSDSDPDYIPPNRPSDTLSNPSRETSPEYRPSGSGRAQVDSTAGNRQSARTALRAQRAALYSCLHISSDDAEPWSPPRQASRVRPASHVLVLKLPKLPPSPSILESERRQLFTGSLPEAPLTRGAATRLASAVNTLLPTLDLETSQNRMSEEPQPSSQQNETQSSYIGTGDPGSARPAPSGTVSCSMMESPLRDPGAPPGLLPLGNFSMMPDQRRDSVDGETRMQSTFLTASSQSNPRLSSIENNKKRSRKDSTSLIPENQGGPAKFNNTNRHRIGLDHAKSKHTHPKPALSRQSNNYTWPGGPITEPCGRTFTAINNECGVQESVPSNDPELTVSPWVYQPRNYPKPSSNTVSSGDERPMESVGPDPLEFSTPMQQNAQPSTRNTSTVEDEAARQKISSGPLSTVQAAQTEDDRGYDHGSSTPILNLPPQKTLRLRDLPKRKVKINILLDNRDGVLVPWSYEKLSDTTPEDLLRKIANDNGLPPEQVLYVQFTIPKVENQPSITVGRDSIRPGEALKTMVTEFSKGRKGLEICEVIATPIISGDVDSEVEAEE